MVEVQVAMWYVACILLGLLLDIHRRVMNRTQRRFVRGSAHYGYIMKRRLFYSCLTLLELNSALLMNIDVGIQIHFVREEINSSNTNSPVEHVVGIFYHCILYTAVTLVFLSVTRCLVQRLALADLCRSDIMTMTRFCLLPSTCVVTVLSVCSWFHHVGKLQSYSDQEKLETLTVHNSSATGYIYILFGISVFLQYNFMKRQMEKNEVPLMKLNAYSTIKQHKCFYSSVASLNKVGVYLPQTMLSTKTTGFAKSDREENAMDMKLSMLGTKGSGSTQLVGKSWITQLPDGPFQERFKTNSENEDVLSNTFQYKRLSVFLSTRFYIAFAGYFVIMMCVYKYTEYAFLGSTLNDFRSVIFLSVLVINSSIRMLQIKESESFETKTTYKIQKTFSSEVTCV